MKITFETAKLAKEKGFDKITDEMYPSIQAIPQLEPYNKTKFTLYKDYCLAPIQSELQRWLREEHGINVIANWYWNGSDEYVYIFEIEYVPQEYQEEKRRVSHVKRIHSYSEAGACYHGGYDKYEEALEAGLAHALTLIK